MKRQFCIFLIRWLMNSFGLWVAVRLFGTGEYVNTTVGIAGFLFAGLVFSIVNSIIKPFIVILSLPAILVSLGLFMLVVNGLMVYISLAITHGMSMTFLNSILTGIILSLVNYIVSAAVALKSDK